MQCLSSLISPLLFAYFWYKRRSLHGWVSIKQLTGWTKSSWSLLSSEALCKLFFFYVCQYWQGCFRLSEEVVRKPKLFFVSTSATTSTLQTASLCWHSSASITTCTGRKKRTISLDGVEPVGAVQPSTSQVESVESSFSGNGKREGRFLLYWITTTSISTSTSFTTTFTITSVLCTPPGANICG